MRKGIFLFIVDLKIIMFFSAIFGISLLSGIKYICAEEVVTDIQNHDEINADLTTYYPLKAGDKWIYSSGTNNYRVSSTKTVDAYIEKYNAYLISFVNKVGISPPIESKEVVEVRDNKVLVLATQSGLDNSLEWSTTPEIRLQMPLKVGAKWAQTWIDNKDKTIMQCRILSFEEYKVGASNFKNVCKVEKVTTLKSKGKVVYRSMRYEYYAPNIGIIDTVLVESSSVINGKAEKSNNKMSLGALVDYNLPQ